MDATYYLEPLREGHKPGVRLDVLEGDTSTDLNRLFPRPGLRGMLQRK